MVFAVTGLGAPVLVTARSQSWLMSVRTLVLLLAELGSLVVAETDEFVVMVAAVTDDATFKTTMIAADAPGARLGSVHVTEVVVVQVQPAGAETETNVVLAGIAWVNVTPEAATGPLLVTVCA